MELVLGWLLRSQSSKRIAGKSQSTASKEAARRWIFVSQRHQPKYSLAPTAAARDKKGNRLRLQSAIPPPKSLFGDTPWCNGNTAPFGGVILGSNPSGVA